MLCSNCHQNQATHTVLRGDGDSVHLCDACFERFGAAADFFGSDPDFFASFLQSRKDAGTACPVCGTTLADYARTGLLGCAACYETFREDLRPDIRRIHGKTMHTGKHPLGDGKLYELLDERERLRGELERAVREKRMKDAKRLNRDIRDISRMIYDDDFDGEEK